MLEGSSGEGAKGPRGERVKARGAKGPRGEGVKGQRLGG